MNDDIKQTPVPAVPAQTGMQSLEWDAVNSAANTANINFGQWMPERWLQEFVKAYNASIPDQPVQQPAPAAEPHYEAGRKQGRAEALAILMELDPEGGIDNYTGWSTPVGPEDEGAAYWEEDKLRELFAADSALADMMDRAEAEYWKYLGIQDEAERAKNFAANMHNSGKVREVLSRAGEFDLMGHLCTTPPVQPFQQRVQPWMMACFGAEVSADTKERNHRFFEESTELVQAGGMTASEAHQLVDYVYGRPVGEPAQEVGGVMVTLAALCLANGLDMHQAAEVELARIWTKVEAIRAKQAAKPKHSPLPISVQANSGHDAALRAAVGKLIGAKGRFHTAQNYAAVVAAYNAVTASAEHNQETSP